MQTFNGATGRRLLLFLNQGRDHSKPEVLIILKSFLLALASISKCFPSTFRVREWLWLTPKCC